MSKNHDAAIGAIEQLIEANKEMRRSLQANEVLLRRARKLLEQGAGLKDTFEKVAPSDPRLAITAALQKLVKARHQLRLTVFAVGLEEGMTIGELSRFWGFSRQLGARYAKESRANS
ncbi:MAG: hypothetical protein ACRD1G_11845 [Acidimicrobiales bacterium]